MQTEAVDLQQFQKHHQSFSVELSCSLRFNLYTDICAAGFHYVLPPHSPTKKSVFSGKVMMASIPSWEKNIFTGFWLLKII